MIVTAQFRQAQIIKRIKISTSTRENSSLVRFVASYLQVGDVPAGLRVLELLRQPEVDDVANTLLFEDRDKVVRLRER
jgi:hypothetical protein